MSIGLYFAIVVIVLVNKYFFGVPAYFHFWGGASSRRNGRSGLGLEGFLSFSLCGESRRGVSSFLRPFRRHCMPVLSFFTGQYDCPLATPASRLPLGSPQILICGGSGGTSRFHQLTKWFGLCDLVAERDYPYLIRISYVFFPPHEGWRMSSEHSNREAKGGGFSQIRYKDNTKKREWPTHSHFS